jgi:RimJ/RimL family protein N-acetyltransferase
MTSILIHENVTLRPTQKEDFKKLWNVTKPATFSYMLNALQTYEEFEKWMNAGLHQMITSDATMVFTVVHSDTGEIMGSTRIYQIDFVNKSCEIGSTFYGEAFQRTHVNTTAKWLLLTYVFETLDMIRVQFKTDVENLRSQKAIERIGAIKEGILRNERIRSTGLPRNAVVYSVINEEWIELKKQLENKLNNYA